jgi:hypothetical protein
MKSLSGYCFDRLAEPIEAALLLRCCKGVEQSVSPAYSAERNKKSIPVILTHHFESTSGTLEVSSRR